MALQGNRWVWTGMLILLAGLGAPTANFAQHANASRGHAPKSEASPQKNGEHKANADIEEVGIEEFSDDTSKEVEKDASVTDKLLLEEVTEPEGDFHYAAFNRPDPFVPPKNSYVTMVEDPDAISSDNVGETDGDQAGGDGKRLADKKGFEIPVIHPLQRYKPEELELKGIWKMDNGEKRAMLLTPDRQGVIVKEDDPVASGKITLIEDKRLTIRLYYIDQDGVRKFNDEKMYLGRPPDKKSGVIRLKPGEAPQYEIHDKEKIIHGAGSKFRGGAGDGANFQNPFIKTQKVPQQEQVKELAKGPNGLAFPGMAAPAVGKGVPAFGGVVQNPLVPAQAPVDQTKVNMGGVVK